MLCFYVLFIEEIKRYANHIYILREVKLNRLAAMKQEELCIV